MVNEEGLTIVRDKNENLSVKVALTESLGSFNNNEKLSNTMTDGTSLYLDATNLRKISLADSEIEEIQEEEEVDIRRKINQKLIRK